jgi:hypothetical protein
LTLSFIRNLAYQSYAWIVASISWRVATISAYVGGAVGAILGAAAFVGAGRYFGTYRKFY